MEVMDSWVILNTCCYQFSFSKCTHGQLYFSAFPCQLHCIRFRSDAINFVGWLVKFVIWLNVWHFTVPMFLVWDYVVVTIRYLKGVCDLLSKLSIKFVRNNETMNWLLHSIAQIRPISLWLQCFCLHFRICPPWTWAKTPNVINGFPSSITSPDKIWGRFQTKSQLNCSVYYHINCSLISN
jgi:hypothetical protein